MDDEAMTLALDRTAAAESGKRIQGVVIGMLVGFAKDGTPLVLFSGNPTTGPVRAKTTAPLSAADRGRELALLFEDGNPRAPVVLGKLHKPDPAEVSVLVDSRERLELSAEKDVVIRCGKASITLTREGKVLIRGTYLLSRSTGVNKIKGGSIELN